MLRLTIPAREFYIEETNEFITTKEQTLQLEHSLVSLSKWESKWCKSFISSREEKTREETIDYIKCMTITQNVDPSVYTYLTQDNINKILEYINAPMTATFFSDDKTGKTNREPITSELIYYWMVSLQIPFKCEKWHLNRLITLIRVCNLKNQPPKRMSNRDIMSRNARLNAARRQKHNTKG